MMRKKSPLPVSNVSDDTDLKKKYYLGFILVLSVIIVTSVAYLIFIPSAKIPASVTPAMETGKAVQTTIPLVQKRSESGTYVTKMLKNNATSSITRDQLLNKTEHHLPKYTPHKNNTTKASPASKIVTKNTNSTTPVSKPSNKNTTSTSKQEVPIKKIEDGTYATKVKRNTNATKEEPVVKSNSTV